MIFLAVLLAVCFASLGYICLADARTRRIPWKATLIVCIDVLLLSFLMSIHALPSVLPYLPAPLESAAWMAGSFLVLGISESIWRASHHGAHGMGWGDIKLLAVLAGLLTFLILPVIFLSCLSALLYALIRHCRTFAFGPHICAWASIALMAQIIL